MEAVVHKPNAAHRISKAIIDTLENDCELCSADFYEEMTVRVTAVTGRPFAMKFAVQPAPEICQSA